jgi:lipopolysaccharide heptosyltransferase II
MKKIFKDIKILVIKVVIDFFNTIGMKKNLPHAKPERFLVISTTGIGDTLWGTPAIRALKEKYPLSYIGFLTNPHGIELLKGNPNIDELFVFHRGFKGLSSLPGLLKSLREKKFEVIFIFHASDRIIWPLAFFTGAGKIIGITANTKGLDFILTNPISLSDNLHGIEMRLELIKEVDAIAEKKFIDIYLNNDDREWAEQFLKNKKINTDSPVTGLHPGAQKEYKCWPKENFINLGNEIIKRFNCLVIVTGNNEEKPLANRIASQMSNAISVAGALSIRETAALIEKMDLFITNDTGPMHMAYALKTPTIALFSPTDPVLCGPYKAQGKFKVIYKQVICNPCKGKSCDKPKCMEQIAVTEVLESAGSLLNK